MAILAENRALLSNKGYQQVASNPTQELLHAKITIHTHPLLISPVVLIGADTDLAKEYQNNLVIQATTRK